MTTRDHAEDFADLEQPKWMWCHEGTTLHILWLPGEEETDERLKREFGRDWSPDILNQAAKDSIGIARLLKAFGGYALCGTKEWKISDGDQPPVGREDLICGACMDAFDERYGTDEIEVKPVSAADRYKQYLETDLWKRTRELAIEFYGARCCLCNSPKNLNVHHRTYERVGSERLSDLIVLCRKCHAHHHSGLPV